MPAWLVHTLPQAFAPVDNHPGHPDPSPCHLGEPFMGLLGLRSAALLLAALVAAAALRAQEEEKVLNIYS